MCMLVPNWIHYQIHYNPNKEYVFISHYPKWQGFHFIKCNAMKTVHAMLWEWSFSFGFWAIHKWKPTYKMEQIFEEQYEKEYGEKPNYKTLWDFYFRLNGNSY